MYKKPKFINNNFYHVYNRGVEKREIFLDDFDYLRFIHDLYEFNDSHPALKFSIGDTISDNRKSKKRNLLVDIICYCLMPNHFHLILRQRIEGGIVEFMRKLGVGYAMYFNQKYKRIGGLFQGRFKAIMIDNDEYLIHLSRYIHLNPIELVEKDWLEWGIQNRAKVEKFLIRYRWSSYLDYLGIKNFPSVIQPDFIWQYFEVIDDYRKFIESFAHKNRDWVNIRPFTLED